MTVLLLILLVVGVSVATKEDVVKNLIGEPDYRQVRLRWESDIKSLPFQIRYCELQSWGAHRCRTQDVQDAENPIDQEDNTIAYSTNVEGLRMATTYSFEVKAARKDGEREDRADGDDNNQNIIVIPTKGFSARATQCLPHASEIEVATGPYFGGRIAVEAADGERCALDGEPHSARDTYTLRINHQECGSHVNDTTVATFVIVQENLPILTHSTRRFLVICSYHPETLTVRAGLNLPTGRGQVHVPAAEKFEGGDNHLRKGRNMRTGKMLQKPEALVSAEEEFATVTAPSTSNTFPIAIITLLSIAGIIGIVAIAIKLTAKNLQRDMDNVSIGSDVSTTSCTTTAEVEIVTTDKAKANKE